MKNFKQLFSVLGFDEGYFNDLALSTGFKKRTRILTAFEYVFALLYNAGNDVVSYNSLASSVANESMKFVSKQALHKIMSKRSCVLFFGKIWRAVLLSKFDLASTRNTKYFSRILVHDSTIIKLHKQLFAFFSGSRNQFKQVVNARIQFAIDLVTNRLVHYKLDAYSKIDQVASKELIIKKKDLVIRDRGYFLIQDLIRIINMGAFFIMRYKHGMNYYDAVTGKLLDLSKVLNKKSCTDIRVCISSPSNPAVRLLAMPVTEEIANIRRANTKKSACRNNKNKPSDASLKMLSWTIYITNIDSSEFSFKQIHELYKLRWRIEILFKAMKSGLNLDSIHNVPKNQLTFILYAKMIMFTLYHQIIFHPIQSLVYKNTKKELSFLKLIMYLKNNLTTALKILMTILINKAKKPDPDLLKYITKYCCYETRRDRTNFYQDYALS